MVSTVIRFKSHQFCDHLLAEVPACHECHRPGSETCISQHLARWAFRGSASRHR
ncbi:hypothetical protein EE612_053317 [Oryza sativa]|nr:hypothetical protein EE612_053317 [Oryza sativa]